ncbi:MAG: hypothetical protein M3459_11055 [Actinomycetota bacterium]|nr:hypothetical protein [Actinomycetota bacterium]
MASLRLITVPYHDGRRDFGRGLGPARLAREDLLALLRAQGWSPGVEEIVLLVGARDVEPHSADASRPPESMHRPAIAVPRR